MKPSYLAELEAGLQAGLDQASQAPHQRSGLAVLVADRTTQRLIEGAAVQLELEITVLDPQHFEPEACLDFELVFAEDYLADRLRAYAETQRGAGEGLGPAIIAVRHRSSETPDPKLIDARPFHSAEATPHDGVLTLPLSPAAMVEQLSLILYANRAFARRFQSALEELHLNRRIFRSVTSGISVANATLPDMPLVYVNPAFEVMTGYCLEDVQGRNCRFLQGEDREQPPVALLREAIAERREITVILKNYRKNGTFFWNELSLSPIRNREGEVTHFVGIQTDVTARVEFEAALRESEKLAAVGRLASSIAHEINNPLESVMNLLYLAQHTEEAAELRSYLALAEKELQRASQITSQSLRFYKQSTRPQAITCTDLLKSVLDLYEGRADNAHVHIERRERSTAHIVCLESEIRQVLNNLVRNAIDAMHGRGGRLLIRTRETTFWRADRAGQRGVLITIADTGSGISASTMSSIYKAFFTTKGLAGTGLGLWISSEIVARHKGSLKVRSRVRNQPNEPGGTVFELFLPLEAAPAQ